MLHINRRRFLKSAGLGVAIYFEQLITGVLTLSDEVPFGSGLYS